MSSLLGFLGAIGDSLSDGDLPTYLTRLNNAADPVAAAARQDAQAQQSALAALAQNRDNGVVDPQQNLNTIAQYLPQYAGQAASLQAQNPLGAILNRSAPTQGSLPAGQSPQPQAQPLNMLSGDDLLKALPSTIAPQVQALADGKMQFPTGKAMTSPYWQQMLQLVSQYDPSFDATNYNARSATRKAFTGDGAAAKNITSLNTAMGHAASLKDSYDKLDNSDYPTVNAIKNWVGNEVGNQSIQTNTAKVGADAHALSEELAKVFRSTGMAESDVKAWESKINTNSTPAQSKAVLNEAVDLMNSRLDALGQQYNQGMGTTKQGIELLSPHAQKAYQKLTGNLPAQTSVSGNLQSDNAASAPQDPVARAKAAGYTDAEIQGYLAKKGKK